MAPVPLQLFHGAAALTAGPTFLLSPLVGQPFYDYVLYYSLKYPEEFYDARADNIDPTDCHFKSDNGSKLHGLM